MPLTHLFGSARLSALPFILIASLSVAFSPTAQSQTNVTLEWSPSIDPSVLGYRIYYGPASGIYTNFVTVGNEDRIIIQNLRFGKTYYFAATSYNSAGVESDYSNEVSFRAPGPPNPFPEAAGLYNGLFYETNQVNQISSGYFKLSATTRGTYSGQLQIGTKRYAMSGRFDEFGQIFRSFHAPRSSPVEMTLRAANSGQGSSVSGEVGSASWTAALAGQRTSFNSRSHPAPLAGLYTMLVVGRHDDPGFPGGDSFAMMRVTASGSVAFAGVLADGSKGTQGAWLSDDGFWPCYLPLYGDGGSLLSWLKFGNEPHQDFRGLVSWIRPANNSTPFYVAGFTNDCSAHGSVYTPPSISSPDLFPTPYLRVAFSGGDLSSAFTNSIKFVGANRILQNDGTPLTLSFSTSSGALTGKVTDPFTGKPLTFRGVIFQRLNTAFGFLLGKEQSSLVTLE